MLRLLSRVHQKKADCTNEEEEERVMIQQVRMTQVMKSIIIRLNYSSLILLVKKVRAVVY